MIKIQKISNKQVNSIPIPEADDKRPIKGAILFKELYANIFICAKKKSGKTSVIFEILKDCVGKNTSIIVFCSTLNKDSNWKVIQDYFEDKGVPFIGYPSLFDDETDRIEELREHLDELAIKREMKKQRKEEHKHNPLIQDSDDEDEKLPYLAPEYIIVLDDLSNELKSKSLVKFMRENRHFKCKTIISSQYLHDLNPGARKQIDVFILFKSFPQKKLMEIYKDADLPTDFEDFEKLYEHATAEPYSFLYVDTKEGEYRKNFNHRYNLSE